jgi:single-stranded-DNA-specific exonuclease
MPETRLQIPPAPFAAVAALERDLGCSHAVAQVLVRRGLGSADAARAWLAADERHPPEAFGGMDEAVAVVLRHVAAGARIVVHGDYDVDGVCSTAILVRALRELGADVGWYLPSRT